MHTATPGGRDSTTPVIVLICSVHAHVYVFVSLLASSIIIFSMAENPSKKSLNSLEDIGDYDENIVKEILQSGVNLRSYSAEVEKNLTELENDTIADYIKEADNISELHEEITASDAILERLEGMLCVFQADLSNICQEILSLQELSASLNIRLKNKQSIRNAMNDFIEDIIIPETVIKHIVETPVSEKEFLEQLIVLDHKISFVKVKTCLSNETMNKQMYLHFEFCCRNNLSAMPSLVTM